MDKKIKDLSITEFSSLVKRIVRKELKNYDPDDGLELRDNIKTILRKSVKDRKSGKTDNVSLEKAFS